MARPKRLDWKDFERGPRGVLVRLGFRRLVSDFWGPLLQPQYFHTWAEILTANHASFSDRPLAVGIYDKDMDEPGRAVVMSQDWEYEPEQIERFDPGFLTVELPDFHERDLAQIEAICFDDEREVMGPYAFLVAWRRHLGSPDTHNCMTWVERFVRAHGGPHDILDRLEEAFSAHLATRS